ncbi:MAG TPA: FAD-dependent oxidoreductase, partial [bacterium]|nr:FAD-dependent oxidoreductase [bacterium]
GRPEAIAATTLILLASCWVSNLAFSKLWRIRSNPESSLITALILALILEPSFPVSNPHGALVVALAGAAGTASKYLLAFRRQHVFNPAAAAALFSGLVFGSYASWWVGATYMLPLVAVGGLLILRKVNRFRLAGVFLGAFLAVNVLLSILNGMPTDMMVQSLGFVFGQSAVIFFAVVMLTEPAGSPRRFSLQALYAGVVAVLYQPQLAILGHNLTPEQALMAGNLFSYLASPSWKLRLALRERRQIGPDLYSFTFDKPSWFRHLPGQYMEWSLPIHTADSRGTRRYFSLASSPTEDQIMVVARFPSPPSSFKAALLARSAGDLVTAGELAGDFTLPRGAGRPLAFIAGGIGITPFRSMVKNLLDRGEKRDIVLVYAANTEHELAFRDVFEEAERTLGVKVVYVIRDAAGARPGWQGKVGLVDAPLLQQVLPDAAERLCFVSGPPAAVDAMTAALRSVGVKRTRIRTDFFPGYAADKLGSARAMRQVPSPRRAFG